MTWGTRPWGVRSWGDSATADQITSDTIPVNFEVIDIAATLEVETTLEVGPLGTIFPIAATLETSMTLAAQPTTVLDMAAHLPSAVAFDSYLPSEVFGPTTPDGNYPAPSVDPVTVQGWFPPGLFRVELVSRFGSHLASLENAEVADGVRTPLNEWETWQFRLLLTDAKVRDVLEKDYREVQLWVGDLLYSWGPIKQYEVDGEYLTCRVVGVGWYLSRRVVGDPNRIDRAINGDFTQGIAGWNVSKTKWFLDFAPLAPGDVTPITTHGVDGAKTSIQLRSDPAVAASAPDGSQRWGDVFGWQELVVNGGTRGVEITMSGHAKVLSDGLTGWNEHRGGVLLARLPLLYRFIDFQARFGQPDHHGGLRNLYTSVIEYSTSRLDETTPRDRWERHETSIVVPPGETEVVHCRFMGVAGKVQWDRVRIHFDDALEFWDVDQSAIVAGYVAHAQDPAFKKSDLNMTTENPPTGVLRRKVSLHSEHEPIWGQITDFTQLRSGMDIGFRYTPTKRIVTTHHPRKGTLRAGLQLAWGTNISSFAFVLDGDQAASSVILLGSGSGSDREEAGARNPAGYANELILETVIVHGQEIPVQWLPEIAAEKLDVSRFPYVVKVVTVPHDPNVPGRNLFGRLQVGDWVPLEILIGPILDADGNLDESLPHPWSFHIEQEYRVVDISLRRNLSLELTLNRTEP